MSSTTRKRGGQPGNRNAIKHGAYSTYFKRSEITTLDQSRQNGMQDEIDMLRVLMRRVVARLDPEATLEETVDALRALSVAVVGLNRLFRTQLMVAPSSGLADFLRDALEDIQQSGAFPSLSEGG